jgi:zinc transport system substrate-binding protein
MSLETMTRPCSIQWFRLPLGLLVACGLLLSMARCGPASSADATPAPDPSIAASFHPAAYVAERIAAGLVPVRQITPPDADAASWKPDAATIEGLQRTKLTIVNGAGLERWTKSASLPEFRTLVLSRSIRDRLLTTKEVAHSHGSGPAHVHRGIDPHTWMDPSLLAIQAKAVLEAMSRAWPEHEVAFAKAHDALAADLAALDARLATLTPSLKGVVVMASHPTYGYLARRHGWTVIDIDLPPDATPATEALATIDEVLARDAAGWLMLFERPPAAPVLDALRARPRLKAVVFSPCERKPPSEQGDFLAVMNANIDRLTEALGATARQEPSKP